MLPTFLLLNRMATERRNLREERDAIRSLKNDQNTLDVEYCRTCLNTQDLEVIFYDEESEEKRSEELRLATGLEIKLNDGLSQKICNSCIDSLETSLQFRHASRKAEKALLKMLCNDSSKKYKSKISKSVKKSRTKRERVDSIELRTKTEEEDAGYDDGYIYEDSYETEVDKIFDEDVPDIKLEQAETGPGRKKRQPIPNAASYKCNTCGKEFRMKATYKAHMRFHTSYCVCESCGKRCRNNNQLQEHKRARHGLGRIHKCAYCEYSSATKEALTIHERRHTGERPYVCDHCGATFHRRSNLVQHIAIHLPEKNFQCDMCPKRLKSRKFLQIHKHNAHTGKRYGYLCSICEHRFEKPNKCAICSKREKSRKLLQVHEYKRHRENRYRYVCPVCRESFARPGNVRLHLARAHAVPRDAQGRIEKYEINLPPVPQTNIEGTLQ